MDLPVLTPRLRLREFTPEDLPALLDNGNLHLRQLHPQPHQGVCADAIAALEGISREDCDRVGLLSQERAAQAIREGRFARSLIPVHRDDGSLALDRDEYPRAGTTMESLGQLKAVFGQFADRPLDETGTTYRQLIEAVYPDLKFDAVHHAGNSSGVVDGAAALLLASPAYARAQGWKPRARIVAMANLGDSPTLMLNAPVPAARKVLAKAGLTVDDIDLFEINEAFAVVAEKYIRDLKLNRDRVNVNGGAMALGHPIGATGSMLIGTVLDELERRGLQRGLVTEESNQSQYRFQDIVDPQSGAVVATLEHEVRSMRHPMYARLYVNRNPDVTNTFYATGHEAALWHMPPG